jgi:DNA-binding MarR family transcriptional regulator
MDGRDRDEGAGACEPELCNCTALRQAARRVTRLYDEALASTGVGANQYSILATLVRLGPSSVHELAARLVMDRSTLGHLLRPLESRRLVTLQVSEHDGRSRIVAPTPEGKAVVAFGRLLWEKAQGRFEKAVGAGTAEQLRALLGRVTTADLG